MSDELGLALSSAPAMEAAGQPAGEIAHDINNLLTVVSGSALRLRARPELSGVAEDLAQIICAAGRAAELTRQLLAVDREPVAMLLPGAAPASPTDPVSVAGPSGQTGLLAEDDPTLRRLLVSMLEQAGYAALQAGDGLEAMTEAKRHRGPLELLITDVAMPKLSGPQLAENLRDLRPDLKVLFMSGYNDDHFARAGAEPAAMSVIGKPFTPAELIGRVGEIVTG